MDRSDTLTSIKGISDKRAALFQKLGIETIRDLYFFYPRRYEDWSTITAPGELIDGEIHVFRATVSRSPSVNRYQARSTIRVPLDAEGVVIAAIWFNQPWLKDTLIPGRRYLFRGQIEKKGTRLQVTSPQFYPEGGEPPPRQPIYRLVKGLNQKIIRDAVKSVLERPGGVPVEFLPRSIRLNRQLAERTFALSSVHFPADELSLRIAIERLKYEELFLAKLTLALISRQRDAGIKAPVLHDGEAARARVLAWQGDLPYTLTTAQTRAITEILANMAQSSPMHRLLQGDVGSGKTVVAAAAVYYAVQAGGQAAFLAPTAILASQHMATLEVLFAGTGIRLALLTGQMPIKERRAILAGLADGTIDVIVGTHALLEPTVVFQNLVLAITDEQHRFGVIQRSRLSRSENDVRPHVLVMSATPIPRTLALIVYGDLDISVIDEIPPGRPEIKTYTARSTDWPRIDVLISKAIARGEQIYVVCPLIEQSEVMDLQAATDVYTALSTRLPDARVALLHGAMKTKEKDRIMMEFMSAETDVLVSTTVVEVGVDNPNATLMLILNAERFGLAQLHQLRGRVGRGKKPGLCIVMSDTRQREARERLITLCKNSDGFSLAEADLAERGPGDFFGTRQHGLPEFRLANLYEEYHMIQNVSDDVEAILAADPSLTKPDHRRLLPAIGERFGDSFLELVL